MTAPTGYAVIRDARQAAALPAHSAGNGARSTRLLGREEGSQHLVLQVSELDAGARIDPHLHAHEETVVVLQGQVELWLGGAWYSLAAGCFAAVPLGSVHSWRNSGDRLARWFTVRAPLPPRPCEPGVVQIDMPDHQLTGEVREAGQVVPWQPTVGRLTDEDLPPYGPLSLGGLGHYGNHVKSISAAMAVDHHRGAIHHTVFMISAPPRTSGSPTAPLPHAHPFEEGFLMLEGETEWELAGKPVRAAAGDLVWAGVGTSHGVMSASGSPARWIEVQAPAPPQRHGFVFPHEWRALAEAQGGEHGSPGGLAL